MRYYPPVPVNLRNVNPSLSELSNVEQWIDSLQVRRGNPGLSPFLYHNNAVEFHVNTAKVKAGFTFFTNTSPHGHGRDPV